MYIGFEDTTTYMGLYALGQYSNSDTTRCRLGIRLNKTKGEIEARVDYQGGTLYPVFYTTEKKPTYRDVGAPSTSGTDASGTWNININGNAATATKAAQDYDGYNITTTYLKRAGGTMTGDISFATIATWPTESGETYPIVSKGLYWNGSSDFAKLFYRVAGSDKGELVMQMGDATDEVVVIENNNGTNYARIGSHGITLNYGATNGTLVTIGANKITTHGNACLTGGMQGGYYGIHLGDTNNYMTIMSGDVHQGLYSPANSNWIIYYNRENGRIGLGTSNLEGYNVTVNGSLKATNLYGTLTGNASSATKLATARTISLGEQFSGSASFNGESNITINGRLKCIYINGGNTNTYVYRRFAYKIVGTGQYNDNYGTFFISANYDNGPWGIFKIGHRTNSTNTACNCSVRWLIRDGFPEDSFTIASWGTTGQNVYCDVFFKCHAAWPRTSITAIGHTSFNLLESTEGENASSASEAYTSVAAAGTALHGQAYTTISNSTQAPIYGAVWN